jgi:ribosomal protein S19E (S16A)
MDKVRKPNISVYIYQVKTVSHDMSEPDASEPWYHGNATEASIARQCLVKTRFCGNECMHNSWGTVRGSVF